MATLMRWPHRPQSRLLFCLNENLRQRLAFSCGANRERVFQEHACGRACCCIAKSKNGLKTIRLTIVWQMTNWQRKDWNMTSGWLIN